MKSWKTTAVGVIMLSIIGGNLGVTLLTDGLEGINWSTVIESVMAALVAGGFMMSRDNDVTSEDAGAAPKSLFSPNKPE